MIRFLQILTFLFTATIQVRVHAAEVVTLREETAAIQEPQDCLQEEETCAVKTSNGKRLKLEVGKSEVTLGSETAAIRPTKSEVTLVSGTVLAKSEDSLTISSEFGKVLIKKGQVIVIKEEKRVVARVLSGEVYIQPRGQKEVLPLEAGQENFLGAVDKTGVAHSGISTAIVFTDNALLWSSLYSGKKVQFEKELQDFAQVWKDSKQKAAATHADLAKRRIASLQEQHQKQQSALKKRQVYEAELRSLFRKKALDQ